MLQTVSFNISGQPWVARRHSAIHDEDGACRFMVGAGGYDIPQNRIGRRKDVLGEMNGIPECQMQFLFDAAVANGIHTQGFSVHVTEKARASNVARTEIPNIIRE
jgi:hypothetical protein